MISKKYFVIQAIFALILVTLSQFSQASRVSELTDRLIDLRKEGQWFVMFYAPWCAHCKRLEPIWSHVAQALHKTNIRVGRVDCTRFTAVADEFGVAGYPTIIFMKGDSEFVFRGDRTKEEMVNFALRLSGPPVQKITKPESFAHLKMTIQLFFVYVGSFEGPQWTQNKSKYPSISECLFGYSIFITPKASHSSGILADIINEEAYYDVAEKFQPHGFFYCISRDLIKDHIPATKPEPIIFVYKENTIYFFEEHHSSENFNTSLHNWVNEERFMTFPKVTRGNLHQFYKINKYLVLAVLEENKLQEISADMLEFRDMVESVIRSHRVRFHKHFQFGWVGSPDLANSIAMSVLPLPHLIVVNSTTRHHHFPQDEPSQLTPQALILFLDQVHNQSAPVFGGNSWWVRLYSLYFEGKTSLRDMWQGNPVLTTLVFGLPMGFLTLICYSICCSDIMDADDEEEEELLHEKKE